MRKNIKRKGFGVLCTALLLSVGTVFPSFAEIRQVSIDADMDNTQIPSAGQVFLPEFDIGDDDNDTITLDWGTDPNLQDPTKAVILKASLYSSSEAFNDNLRVGGKGIRRTYVDSVSVDKTKASVRLEIYPYYRLTEPEGLQVENGKLSWEAVPYAGSYEVVVGYTTKSGTEKTVRKTTKNTSINLSAYFSDDEDEGRYTDVDAAVRAIPSTATDYKYCNIAKSAFASLNGSVDVSEYEEDDVWAKVGQYQAVEDSETGNYVSGSGYYASGSGPSKGADGVWKRVKYQWQFIENGEPVKSAWRQIKGAWYHFDADGFMQTGWLEDNGAWYYLETAVGAAQGVMQTGQHEIDGSTYYFDVTSGAMGTPEA